MIHARYFYLADLALAAIVAAAVALQGREALGWLLPAVAVWAGLRWWVGRRG